ncbi:hypothetical protein AAVH_35139, partial [Aphelenchoides avenae]
MRIVGLALLSFLSAVVGDANKPNCPVLYATWFISDGGVHPPLSNTSISSQLFAQPTPDASFTFFGVGISVAERQLIYMTADNSHQWASTCLSDGAVSKMEQMCPISKGFSGDDTVQVMLLYDVPRPSVEYPLLTVPYKDWDLVDDGYVKRCARGSFGTYDPTGRNVESCVCCEFQKFQQECASDWNIPRKA